MRTLPVVLRIQIELDSDEHYTPYTFNF